jgi:hypothetical protein
MPACKNDSTTKYKGDEPSPKGLGYCAHAQALGSKKTGLDGKQYQVRADKNGKKSWKLASTVPGGAKKSTKKTVTALPALPAAIIDAAVAGVDADSKIDAAVAAVSGAAKAQANATKAITTAVKVGGPAALDAIKQIQARLQTAKRTQIDEYLRAKKKQGLFTKPLKAKGYLMQHARADAIAIRQGSKAPLTGSSTAVFAPAPMQQVRLSQEDVNKISDEFMQNMSASQAQKKSILPKMKKFLRDLRYEPGYVNSWGEQSGALAPGQALTVDHLYAQALSKVAEILKYGGDFEE